MEITEPRWLLRKKWDEENCQTLSYRWKLSPFIIKLLLNRGIKEDSFQRYFSPSFDDLHDPFSMKGMKEAVDRVLLSISRKEKILIWGDFDADGITATSLLLRFMKDLGFPCYYYIPHRQDEGYGLNKKAIKKAFNKNIKLIITCDCGTSSIEEIEFARSLGMEVIVTDHHRVDKSLSPDFIILNPHQPECDYPFKELSGVGVAFKLCQAVSKKVTFSTEKLKTYLDFVAMGTLADMVPLIGENRVMVKLGLERIPSDTTSLGLRALIDLSGLSKRKIEEREIGYILAPRLNACGRLSLAKIGVKLLLTESKKEALLLANKLNEDNSRRRSLEKKMRKEAESIISEKLKAVLIVANENWHLGVIGLLASYLKEKYCRPTLVFSIGKDTARGSARSIPGFSMFEALTKCSHLITEFGGHEMAAGLTLPSSDIKKLEEKLNLIAKNTLPPNGFASDKFFDAELPLEQLDMDFIKELKILSPFGSGNPKPIFLTRRVRVVHSQSINRGKKLLLTDFSGGKEFEALSFDSSNNKNILSEKPMDILYFPTLNNWRGKQNIQLEIKGIK